MIDIGWTLIQHVEKETPSDTYLRMGVLLVIFLSFLPVIYHLYLSRVIIATCCSALRLNFGHIAICNALLTILSSAFGSSLWFSLILLLLIFEFLDFSFNISLRFFRFMNIST